MRVLLSGGIKTQNIVSGISKVFKASGDDFLVVDYIDNIDEIFGRGEFFDKAVITEQSITKEYSITNEHEIRLRINKFANDSAARPKRYSYVFLTQTEKMANIIYEEILPILNDSAVVLKEAPYTVTFFHTIIVDDVKQLPSEIVYVPEMLQPEVVNINTNEKEFDGLDVELEDFTKKMASDDFDHELLDSAVQSPDDYDVDLNLDINDAEIPSELYEKPEEETTDEDEVDEVPAELDAEPEEEIDIYKPIEMDGADYNVNDTTDDIDIIGITPIVQSDELPEYVKEHGEIPEELDKEDDEEDASFIAGFDDANEQDDEIEIDTDINDNNMEYEQSLDQQFYTEQPVQDLSSIGEQLSPNENFMFDTSDYSDSDDFEEEQETEEDEQMDNESSMFSQNDYENEDSSVGGLKDMQNQQFTKPVQETKKKIKLFGKNGTEQSKKVEPVKTNVSVIDKIKEDLRPFAARGNSIVVTGCGGSGTSFVAYSLASIIAQLGYNSLLVDMDMEGRTQNYISRDNYDSMEPDGANLMAAVNSTTGINTHLSVVRTGFHLLSTGLSTDTAPASELLHKERLQRFSNLAKTTHQFTIYDVPFDLATGFLSDITYMADNIALVVDASNWGITKTMLAMCNVGSDDMQDALFNRAQLVFNKYRNLDKFLGNPVKTCADITRVMDKKVLELVGDDTGLHFEDLHIAGILNDDPNIEKGWFEKVQYVDTEIGQKIFLELIDKIVLKL